MPRTNIDYSNTIIYKLCCKDISITELYVGHTTDMRKRKNKHKYCCNNEKNIKYNLNVYQFIRNNGCWDNWDMIEIERYNAIDGYDAKKRERYWIEELKASLNMQLPSRKQKEWEEDNKEYVKERNKNWREINKEILLQKKRQYYENNKDIKNEERKEKVKCECGCEIRKQHLNRHKQSKKHINLMSQPSKSSIIIRQSATDLDTTVI